MNGILLDERGIDEVAVTYTNNDYGRGLAESFTSAYEALGHDVLISAAHEDGRADYSAEVGALSASGADTLVVFGYLDQGGRGIVQASLDTGAFDQFVFGDGMHGQSIVDAIGEELYGRVVGAVPGSDNPGADAFQEMADAAGFEGAATYTGESYDAGALIALAIQAAGSTDRGAIAGALVLPTFRWVVDSLKIDDVCGVFAVHGSAGFIGTMLIPFFDVAGFSVNQLLMQVAGTLVVGTWTVLVTMVVLGVIGATIGLRVSEEEEELGLDRGEHGLDTYPEFTAGDEPGALADGGRDRALGPTFDVRQRLLAGCAQPPLVLPLEDELEPRAHGLTG